MNECLKNGRCDILTNSGLGIVIVRLNEIMPIRMRIYLLTNNLFFRNFDIKFQGDDRKNVIGVNFRKIRKFEFSRN